LEHTPATLEILLLLVNTVVLGIQEVESVDWPPFGAPTELLAAAAAASQELVPLCAPPHPALATACKVVCTAVITALGDEVVTVRSFTFVLVRTDIATGVAGLESGGAFRLAAEWVLRTWPGFMSRNRLVADSAEPLASLISMDHIFVCH
jgi:hypothetical protein